jgi:hypothetical protein
MPATYTLIASNTLSSAAASVTFSAIPATYTDLVLRYSARSDGASVDDYFSLTVNGITTSVYSLTNLTSDGSTVGSTRLSNNTSMRAYGCAGANSTSNTFASGELYIPSYTAAQNKPLSNYGANETNASAVFMGAVANLYRQTTAISSITFAPLVGTNIVSGSSFFLYGIKNS